MISLILTTFICVLSLAVSTLQNYNQEYENPRYYDPKFPEGPYYQANGEPFRENPQNFQNFPIAQRPQNYVPITRTQPQPIHQHIYNQNNPNSKTPSQLFNQPNHASGLENQRRSDYPPIYNTNPDDIFHAGTVPMHGVNKNIPKFPFVPAKNYEEYNAPNNQARSFSPDAKWIQPDEKLQNNYFNNRAMLYKPYDGQQNLNNARPTHQVVNNQNRFNNQPQTEINKFNNGFVNNNGREIMGIHFQPKTNQNQFSNNGHNFEKMSANPVDETSGYLNLENTKLKEPSVQDYRFVNKQVKVTEMSNYESGYIAGVNRVLADLKSGKLIAPTNYLNPTNVNLNENPKIFYSPMNNADQINVLNQEKEGPKPQLVSDSRHEIPIGFNPVGTSKDALYNEEIIDEKKYVPKFNEPLYANPPQYHPNPAEADSSKENSRIYYPTEIAENAPERVIKPDVLAQASGGFDNHVSPSSASSTGPFDGFNASSSRAHRQMELYANPSSGSAENYSSHSSGYPKN